MRRQRNLGVVLEFKEGKGVYLGWKVARQIVINKQVTKIGFIWDFVDNFFKTLHVNFKCKRHQAASFPLLFP